VTKERRLGRGLEALLGRVATKTETASSPAFAKPSPRGPFPSDEPDESPYDAHDAYASPEAGEPQYDQEPSDDEVALPAQRERLDLGLSLERPASAATTGPMRLPLRQIESNPFQPRQEFDEADIQSLCDSLRAHGLLQPVVVRRVDGHYQLVAGERRLRAAMKAGWTDVPVQVVEADDRQTAELAIIENLQRKDLNPLEKAASFQRYLEQYGCTQEELAGRLKLDRSTIANLIRLLELPGEVQDALRQGRITQGHARSLLPLGDEREQIDFCQRIQTEGLSVRQTETIVQETINQADANPLSAAPNAGDAERTHRVTSEHVAALEQEFRAALGTRVKITHNAKGRGKLVVQFANHDEFERIRALLCGSGPCEAAVKHKKRAG
jgi:ParB family chromosome partitioning protein